MSGRSLDILYSRHVLRHICVSSIPQSQHIVYTASMLNKLYLQVPVKGTQSGVINWDDTLNHPVTMTWVQSSNCSIHLVSLTTFVSNGSMVIIHCETIPNARIVSNGPVPMVRFKPLLQDQNANVPITASCPLLLMYLRSDSHIRFEINRLIDLFVRLINLSCVI